jgi:hypothetical protein
VVLRSVLQLLGIANVVPSSDYFHSGDGSDTFLRNVGSYMSYTASHLRGVCSPNISMFINWYSVGEAMDLPSGPS